MRIHLGGERLKKESWSRDFHDVLHEELDLIQGRAAATPPDTEDSIVRAHDARLFGVAFSGGGIRSATFNLGVLQGLAKQKLLEKVHYLSTVSGGGYIGSWLMAWLHRRGMEEVTTGLQPSWCSQPSPEKDEPPEVRALRRYSNYLTPKLGWFGADLWTVIAIYLRNLLLNLVVLACVLAVLLLVPRWVGWHLYDFVKGNSFAGAIWVVAAAVWLGITLYYRSLYRSIAVALGSVLSLLVVPFILTQLLQYLGYSATDLRWVPIMTAWLIAGLCIAVNLSTLHRAIRRDSTGRLDPTDVDVVDEWAFPTRWVRVDEAVETPIQSQSDLATTGGILYLQKELEDFSARIDFIPESADDLPDIYVHIPVNDGKLDPAPVADTRVLDLAKADDLKVNANDQNCLEILSHEDLYTVRLNGRTIHSRQMQCSGGWIGLQSKVGVEYQRVLVRPLQDKFSWLGTQLGIQLLIVVPITVLCLLTAGLFYQQLADGNPRPDGVAAYARFASWGTAFGFVIVVVSLLLRGGYTLISPYLRSVHKAPAQQAAVDAAERSRDWRCRWLYIRARMARDLFPLVAMPLACAPAACAVGWVSGLFDSLWPAVSFGPPLLLSCVVLAIYLYLGIMGLNYRDEIREWWSRLAAWLLITAIVWVALFGIALYVPPVLRWSIASARGVVATLGVGWVITTVGGLLAAKSSATGTPRASRSQELLVGVAPYVFILGLFSLLALGVDAAFLSHAEQEAAHEKVLEWQGTSIALVPTLSAYVQDHELRLLNCAAKWHVFWAAVGAGLIATGLSLRLDINQFSMHMLYRNRLVRCYLGASNCGPRVPQQFTGFDAADDFELEKLKDLFKPGTDEGRQPAPYPIINTALNLASGSELEWQQRKAASFVFTPAYCGYDFAEQPPGFVRTEHYAKAVQTFASQGQEEPPGLECARKLMARPLTLGTAMAISGAAVSPNSGYHTSPAPAFLMTVFNVRLGWWLGNTRNERGYSRSSPALLVTHLLMELFGLTNARDRYVYLSDGGHFENLGIYELVRRRCRYIIACDAEEDHDFTFGGLGSAIEKCRSDFGVEIDIDVEPIRRRNNQEHSRWHCAIGTIRYHHVDGGREEGTLIYLKSSLTGDEPTDILRYRDANPEFPHQSTADQWFDESQFESYRRLGLHVIEEVIGPAFEAVPQGQTRNLEEIFLDLRQRWYPPAEAAPGSFSRHAEECVAIFQGLRDIPELRFLTDQLYPQWNQLAMVKAAKAELPARDAAAISPLTRAWLPASLEELRHGFYMCNAVIQLMENVYNDLHLERQHCHPDHRGWMNFFRHWSWSDMFRITWTVCASTYGARFQRFCEKHLDLRIGSVLELTAEPVGMAADLAQFSTEDCGLNRLEMELIRLFFNYRLNEEGAEEDEIARDAAIRAEGQVFLLRLTPEENLVKRPDGPIFTFGFLIARPVPGAAPEPGPRKVWEILYLRVQDHVRKMGLARRAIATLLDDKDRSFHLNLRFMDPDAHEAPKPEELARFGKLFESVRTAKGLTQNDRIRAVVAADH